MRMATIKTVKKGQIDASCFNSAATLPYNLRIDDFRVAMQDVYDFLHDTNTFLVGKELSRLDDTLRPANMSGFLSDMLTDSMAKHARSLTRNTYHNGHPDLIVKGVYADDSVKSGSEGVEIKTTKKKGGAVDTHGGRDQWMCVFVYSIDNTTQPAISREALTFTEVYICQVTVADFRHNPRGELGTRTSTLGRNGIAKLRSNWVYLKN